MNSAGLLIAVCRKVNPTLVVRGFTVIEMVIVVAIIALLAGILTPLVFNVLDEGNEAATRDEMKNIRDALTRYYEHVNQWPPTWCSDGQEVYCGLKMLAATQTEHGYLVPSDESGTPYSYAAPIPKLSDSSYGIGWNGPYIADSQGGTGFYSDAWDQKYAYVSYPGYYVVRVDPTQESPSGVYGYGKKETQYYSVPIQPARVFIASKGRDQRHTNVPPTGAPSLKSEQERYPENIDDLVLMVSGTDYAKSWWFPLPATEAYK